jgi:hypothetical protein
MISSESANLLERGRLINVMQVNFEKIPEFDRKFHTSESIIRSMMKHMFKKNDIQNNLIFFEDPELAGQLDFAQILGLFTAACLQVVEELHRSMMLLCEFLRIRFLTSTIIDKSVIPPTQMIDMQSFIVSTPSALLEPRVSTQHQQLEDFQRVHNSVDVQISLLSPNSKLQSISSPEQSEEKDESSA